MFFSYYCGKLLFTVITKTVLNIYSRYLVLLLGKVFKLDLFYPVDAIASVWIAFLDGAAVALIKATFINVLIVAPTHVSSRLVSCDVVSTFHAILFGFGFSKTKL